MKLNLGCGTDIRDGYINIDLDPKGPSVINQDFRRLDNICGPNQVDEIIANGSLQHIFPEELSAVLNHWISKLQSGGILYISGTDLSMIANAVAYKMLNGIDASNILFPKGNVPAVACYDLETLLKLIQSDPELLITKFGYINKWEFEIAITKP